jgi:ABC-type nitrate/sulfonate/bicarbonate transport system substrate-binding protein
MARDCIRTLRAGLVAAALAAAATAPAGCGKDAAGGAESENGRTKLTVGLVPVYELAPVHLGIEKGFFADEGLELEVRTAQGGAEIVPQVVSGSVQVGFSNTPSLFSAAEGGLPVEIVAPAGGSPRARKGKEDTHQGAVMVEQDSPIRSYADLAGKTVAINTVGNVLEVTLRAALTEHGVDSSRVEYLEVPFPDMLAALDAGRVDAVFVTPPFETIAQSGDYRAIGFPFVDVRPDLVFAGYFVSREWAERNPEVLERFLAALRRSMEYAAEHEQETRAAIGEFTELPENVVRAVPIGNRRPDCRELETSSELLGELMVRYGALQREPTVGELVRPGFCDA